MSDNFQKKGARQEKIIFHDEDTPNDNESDSPDSRNEEKDNDHKSKKKYSVISQAIREKFINRVLSKEVTIKEAAKEFGLKFSTSKAILQTYKKEGRIGKKKNRERKTKVVNVVFVCNINPNSPYTSSVFPIIAVNEIKGAKASMNAEDNKNRLVEEALSRYPEHKIIQQSHLQIPNDSNKSTTQFIKELGNEFLKDFIEKNFNPNKVSLSDSLPYGLQNPMNSMPNPQGSMGMGNVPNMSNIVNFNHIQPPHLNGQYGMPQAHNMSTEIPQSATMSHYSLNQPSPNQINQSLNQKRSFQQYERDTIPDLDLKSEQIADISVKKFKSGEEAFYDFDMDRSKKDLEDFIYKTQTAIKNNSYASKDKTFDFSKYRDEFYE